MGEEATDGVKLGRRGELEEERQHGGKRRSPTASTAR